MGTSSLLPHSDSSLVALTGVSTDESAEALLDLFTGTVKSLGASIPADELERAKTSFKLSYASAIESAIESQGLGVELLLRGKHTSLSDMFAAIDAVSASDVQKVIA